MSFTPKKGETIGDLSRRVKSDIHVVPVEDLQEHDEGSRPQLTLCDCQYCDDAIERGEPRAEVCAEPHTCPYQVEVNDNTEYKCTCCENKRQGCVWDI